MSTAEYGRVRRSPCPLGRWLGDKNTYSASRFIADLVSWSAVGASTAASALHRELASGLSTPVGFHATAASADAAVGAVRAASAPHAFLSVSKQGVAGIVQRSEEHTV